MMSEALVARIRYHIQKANFMGLKDAESTLLLGEAADAIEELSMKLHGDEAAIAGMKREIERMVVADKPRWIPVTERLPGREWVLCKCRAKIHEVLSLRDGYWYHDPQHKFMGGFVTHWMPLPAPPKEDKL